MNEFDCGSHDAMGVSTTSFGQDSGVSRLVIRYSANWLSARPANPPSTVGAGYLPWASSQIIARRGSVKAIAVTPLLA
jgi:hypothetical protein